MAEHRLSNVYCYQCLTVLYLCLMIYCGLNNNTFKLFLKGHIVFWNVIKWLFLLLVIKKSNCDFNFTYGQAKSSEKSKQCKARSFQYLSDILFYLKQAMLIGHI